MQQHEKILQVRITPNLKELLEEKARQEGTTASLIAERCIAKELQSSNEIVTIIRQYLLGTLEVTEAMNKIIAAFI